MAAREETEGVAVIGLGALFPGAISASGFWANIASGHDAIGEASPRRLDPRFLDPGSSAVDRLPTLRGGFLGDEIPFDAGGFGIMPVAVPGTEPDQLLTLQVASACLEDAGLGATDLGGLSVGVILGRGGYLTPGMVRLGRKSREAEQLAAILRQVLPGIGESDVQRVKAAYQGASGAYGPDTAIGLVPNLTASRIANRLDLHGPAYTLDAACASSLLAVEHGVRELRSGRCDLVLCGGVHLVDDVPFWSVFTQLGAISRTGRMRPFDRRADGLLIGEGIGILALKRLDRAERDGDRIYAVIRGVGSSSDGRAATVMVPRSAGQVLAIQRAWADARLDPETLGLIEAHGTATGAGDAAEIASLREVFGDRAEVALGSVKSMIGHAMPAAGAAGLIKAVLAIHHGVLPPSLHCEEPHPSLDGTRFEVLGAARDWLAGERVAGVDAFGFGGINAHVVLSSHGEARRIPARRAAAAPMDRLDVEVLALAGDSPEAVLALLASGARRGGKGPCRLALVDPTPERLERARRVVERGAPWAGRGGMWFRRQGLLDAGGKIAFVFPGIEASFSPEVQTVAARFGLPAPALGGTSGELEQLGKSVVGLGRFLNRVVRHLGVRPDVYAGHSVGEWTGMIASGLIAEGEVDAFLERIPFRTLKVPDVLFAAAGCDVQTARRAIDGLDGIAVSHDNCPHQVILCGHGEPVARVRDRLLADGVLCQILPFRSGFHSPLFADYLAPHTANLAALDLHPAEIPLWSATTLDAYPAEPDAIRSLVLDHLVQPLRFRELVETLYERGIRVFVQLGVGSIPGFVSDTLGDRPHLAISASEDRRLGLAQLRNLMLALFVEGAPVDPLATIPPTGTRIPIRLGVPLLSLDTAPIAIRGRPDGGAAEEGAPDPSDPLAAALAEATRALTRGPLEVVRALNRPASVLQVRHPLSVHTVPALRDHAFFPQPPGWPVASDSRPVVPMTMSLTLLLKAAESFRPGQLAIGLSEARALRWVNVEPPVEATIEVRAQGADAASARMFDAQGDYAEARIHLAGRWPEPPAPSLPPLRSPVRPPQTAAEMYSERWMFHGPAYQGVVGLTAMDDTGLDAELVALPAPGALLDAAGQLLGYWLLATTDRDHLTMPTGVKRLSLFGPLPSDGTPLSCRLRVTEIRPQSIEADLEILLAGRLWCRLEGWADHRFEADDPMMTMMRLPERNLLSEDHGDWVLFDDQRRRTPSRDWLMRRYLGEAERDALMAAGPRLQRQLLDDRVAAKDAVRLLLWAEGQGPIFPVELSIRDADPQDPLLEVSVRGQRLWVAVAHCDHRSVAIASREGPPAIRIAPAGSEIPGDQRAEIDGYVIGWSRP